MSKSNLLVLVCAFLFFYTLNHFMPLAFGDDYLYAFIWQGTPMYVPLTEEAVKIASLHDLITSQISFYYTWSGRVVNNTLSQLFVWAGKDVFNIFNTLACVMLVLEMYWCANKGKVTFSFDLNRLAWVFLFFWLFTPSFPSVVFWLVGACHYLWPAVFLTGFLVPYVRKYYFIGEKKSDRSWRTFFMALFGFIAGCTNENSVCWVIMLLMIFVHYAKKCNATDDWMYFGLAGLVLGYLTLMLSPGNFARLQATHDIDWLNQEKVLANLHIFAIVLIIQFLMWYFCLRSLPQIYKTIQTFGETQKNELKKELVLVQALGIIAMGMSIIMLFSPEFHLRSAFPGTVQLIIVTGIVLRMQKEYRINLLQQNAKKLLICVGTVYFFVSAGFTLLHLYEHHVYNEKLLSCVAALKTNDSAVSTVLQVEPLPESSKTEDFLSGFHCFKNNISDDANAWTNVAFARYYGIKGVRVQVVK